MSTNCYNGPFNFVWSGIDDVNLRASAMVIQDGNRYRVATKDDFADIIISGATVSVGAVGITGASGNSLSVVNVSGFNAIPVFIASGTLSAANVTVSGASVAFNTVGITGSGGTAVDVRAISGFNAFPVFIASGSLASIPANLSVRPSTPATKGIYGLTLTGVGVFNNYTTLIPNITGSLVQLSIEPDSQNAFRVWYAFSGTASTGQAWELRGERTFEVTGNQEVFFAQETGSNRVMVHFQTY